MAVLDYNDFTFYNPTGTGLFNVISPQIVVVEAERKEQYAYLDYGAGYFDGDFLIKQDLQSYAGGASTTGVVGFIVLSKDLTTVEPNGATEDAVWCRVFRYLMEFFTAERYNDVITQETDPGPSAANVQYKTEFERSGTTLSWRIYNDAGDTLLFSASQTLTTVEAYRYLQIATGYNSNQNNLWRGDCRNLEIVDIGPPAVKSNALFFGQDF